MRTTTFLRPTALLLTLALTPSALAADCPSPVPVSTLRDALGSAEAAFSAQDISGVKDAVFDAREALPCIDGTLTTEDAAHVHRVEALSSFLDRDLDGTVIHYRAVVRLKPDYTPPAGIAPAGGPLRGQFDTAQQAPAPVLRDVPAPVEGAVLIDGAQKPTAPGNLPFIFQRVDDKGAVQQTSLLEAGADLPKYETARDLDLAARQAPPTRVTPTPAAPEPPKDKGRTRRALMFTGAGLAAAGGAACAGIAVLQRDAYRSAAETGPADPLDYDSIITHAETLDGHINRNQGYLRGAAGLGALGLALGVGGAF